MSVYVVSYSWFYVEYPSKALPLRLRWRATVTQKLVYRNSKFTFEIFFIPHECELFINTKTHAKTAKEDKQVYTNKYTNRGSRQDLKILRLLFPRLWVA